MVVAPGAARTMHCRRSSRRQQVEALVVALLAAAQEIIAVLLAMTGWLGHRMLWRSRAAMSV